MSLVNGGVTANCYGRDPAQVGHDVGRGRICLYPHRLELSLQTIRFPRSGFRLAKGTVRVFRWGTLRRPQLGGVPESGKHFLHELMGALGFDAWSGWFLRMILLFHIVVRSIRLGCVPWIFLST